MTRYLHVLILSLAAVLLIMAGLKIRNQSRAIDLLIFENTILRQQFFLQPQPEKDKDEEDMFI